MRKLMLLLALLAGGAQAQQVDLLVYRVKESGLPPYLSRILVSDAFVRIDEGADSQAGYTLYNRVSHRLYNVDPEERTVLILTPPRRQPAAPDGFRMSAQYRPQPDAPKVGGRQPGHLELLAQGKSCRTLQVVEGVLPRAVQGLRELRLALARLQREPAPGSETSPCELAEYLYAPARHLDHGLPLLDVMPEKRQELVDYDPAFDAPDSLFEVPSDYEVVTPPPL